MSDDRHRGGRPRDSRGAQTGWWRWRSGPTPALVAAASVLVTPFADPARAASNNDDATPVDSNALRAFAPRVSP